MGLPDLWQIGTGDPARPYFDAMKEYGAAMIGPGTPGSWKPGLYDWAPAVGWFKNGPEGGDLVVARRGRRVALGIGVLGSYRHSDALDDVEGWDLQHYRPVKWLGVPERRFKRQVFPLVRFSACNQEIVRRWVVEAVGSRTLSPPNRPVSLPRQKPPLDTGALPPRMKAILKRARLFHNATWEGEFDVNPTEAELVTHITVPLLEALGWSPEQIAVGWGHTDVAVFPSIRREPAECVFVIESKRIGDGLGLALKQADDYRRSKGLVRAEVIVTDGIRYRLHRPRKRPSILYANLVNPRAEAEKLFDALRAT
jgi:hypothetical protein